MNFANVITRSTVTKLKARMFPLLDVETELTTITLFEDWLFGIHNKRF